MTVQWSTYRWYLSGACVCSYRVCASEHLLCEGLCMLHQLSGAWMFLDALLVYWQGMHCSCYRTECILLRSQQYHIDNDLFFFGRQTFVSGMKPAVDVYSFYLSAVSSISFPFPCWVGPSGTSEAHILQEWSIECWWFHPPELQAVVPSRALWFSFRSKLFITTVLVVLPFFHAGYDSIIVSRHDVWYFTVHVLYVHCKVCRVSRGGVYSLCASTFLLDTLPIFECVCECYGPGEANTNSANSNNWIVQDRTEKRIVRFLTTMLMQMICRQMICRQMMINHNRNQNAASTLFQGLGISHLFVNHEYALPLGLTHLLQDKTKYQNHSFSCRRREALRATCCHVLARLLSWLSWWIDILRSRHTFFFSEIAWSKGVAWTVCVDMGSKSLSKMILQAWLTLSRVLSIEDFTGMIRRPPIASWLSSAFGTW